MYFNFSFFFLFPYLHLSTPFFPSTSLFLFLISIPFFFLLFLFSASFLFYISIKFSTSTFSFSFAALTLPYSSFLSHNNGSIRSFTRFIQSPIAVASHKWGHMDHMCLSPRALTTEPACTMSWNQVMQTTVLKAIFAIATFLVCLFAGCLPLSLFQSNVISWRSAKAIRVLRGLLAISLGAFLGICFVGLFPSVQESQDELQSYFKRHLHYPFAEVSILISYFVFWLSAELSKLYFESKQKPEEEQELKEKSSGPTYDSVTSCHDVASHDGSSPMSYFDLVLIVFSLSIKSVLESVAIGTLSDHVTIVQMGSAKLVHESICTLVRFPVS